MMEHVPRSLLSYGRMTLFRVPERKTTKSAPPSRPEQTCFHPTLLRLGLRLRDAYQTRHIFATLALMAGINPAYIARQHGMLFKHYSKWIDGADADRQKSKLNGVF